ncbi:hypothetical protein HMPREF9996_01717 [Aggregatibacter actinomycetemcomitans Y4]|nr:hypothetical protein [Aggregatibacter actinomycetemcomitans]EKX94730.1 hypothetical protein HMPREF9996_01717 [Aggregatibacter actinomycetemcomitans Y4]
MFIHYWLSRWISCGKSAVDFDRTFLTYIDCAVAQRIDASIFTARR